MKTILFTMFLRGWDIIIQQMFQSKIIKNRVCNPNMFFDTSNHTQHEKVTPNLLQQATQNSLEIIKTSS